jgi:DNA-binding transcriptional LysR family regulator
VTELPPFLARDALARGELVKVLPRLQLPEVSINLLYPSHRNPSSLVRAYLGFCRERAEHYLQAVGDSQTAGRHRSAKS